MTDEDAPTATEDARTTTEDAPTSTDPPRGRTIDCRAPSHAEGSRRLLVTPGAVSVGYGAGGHAVLLLRLGRVDGSLETLFRGTSLYGLSEVATGTVADRRPDAVWLTDRSYLLDHWSPWLVRTVESRLAEAAERVDAPLVVWTGERRESSDGADSVERAAGAEGIDC